MSWLKTHLEEFVKPVLGHIPSVAELAPTLQPQQLTLLKNLWRSCKAKAAGKPILLPGRDVWLFEVLARREDYPTLFVPEVSRLTVAKVEIRDLHKYLCVDTGFMGSIPNKLGIEDFALVSYVQNNRMSPNLKQVFPRMTGSRSLALQLEYLPKYWKRGFVDEAGSVSQERSSLDEFEKAAILTQQVYTNSAVRFVVDAPKVVKGFSHAHTGFAID